MSSDLPQPRVLYVDDEQPARRAFRRVIKRKGFVVDIAADANEANELAAQHHYDVIVTDLHMPGTDGVAVIGSLCDSQPHAAFLLVTGAEEMEIPQDTPEVQRVSEIIFKPWHPNELAAALRRAVDQKAEPVDSTNPLLESGPVLLVEHDASVAKLLETTISGCAGVSDVLVAAHINSAIDMLRSTQFTAVFVSLDLPEAPGTQAVTDLVSHAPQIPVIALGTPSEASSPDRVRAAGAVGGLYKHDLDSQGVTQLLDAAREQKRTKEHLHRLAHYDPLTSLANRVHFRSLLQRALDGATPESQVGLLCVDLDRFRDLNEHLGHDVGDALLRAVAQRLVGLLDDPDGAARIASDEFAVMLTNLTGVEDANRIARAIVQAMAKPLRVAERDVFATVSVGIAMSPPSDNSLDGIFRDAGDAMHRAKQAGRNRYRVHVPEMVGSAEKRMSMESDLVLALEREQFEVYYQPLVTLDTDVVVGAEALLRWIHPERGLIAPYAFIPPLEETGLIVQVGEWVLNDVCRQTKEWQEAGLPPLRVAVNIAPVQFQEEDMSQTVRAALDKSGLDPAFLALEITESALLDDTRTTRTSLEAIRDMGVHIALDDFGTGYSSLSYLKKYPIGTLKIDRSFVRDITTEADDAAIALAIVALGKSLRMEVVAEGIETPEQLEFLRGHGCDKYQGYYCSKPVPAAEFATWLAARVASAKDGAAAA